MAIKAGNIIIGGVQAPKAPEPAPITGNTDRVVVTNLQELRSGKAPPPPPRPAPVKKEVVVQSEPESEERPKKRVSKYLADMYNTADLPSFDEEDK